MAEKREGASSVVDAEAKATEIAAAWVQSVFTLNERHGGYDKPGKFWDGVKEDDGEAIKARLREMADLIGDLKRRILEP